jgi:hypothetical protein
MAWWLAQQNPKTKSPGEVARAFVDPGCSGAGGDLGQG